MAQFKQQYFFSWIITYISAAAVCVSCQELTSTLHDGNIACQGKEVVFTCTIEGSATLSTLILAWSSTEYIGRGDPLRFTTEDMRGMNKSINGNVTAILTKNDMNAETRVLESELHIVADQASIVTCSSISASGAESIMFNVSDVPEAPLNVGATEISRLSESVCEIIVIWDPPANDIARYLVYIISSQGNIKREMLIDTTHSRIDSLILTGCRDNNDIGIKVAAINSVDCVGNNSTEVQLERLHINVSTAPLQESSQLGVGAAVGITVGVILPIFFLGVVLVVFIIYCIYVRRKERKVDKQSNQETDMEPLISQLQKEMRETKQEMQEMKQEQDERVEQLRSQLSSEQNNVEALKQQQTIMTEEMTHHVTQLKGQVTQVLSELSSTRKELSALKQQQEMERVTELEEHVKKLENQLSSTLTALEQEQTKERVTKLENQLSSTRKELKALKQEQTEIQSKLNEDLQESSKFTIRSASHQPGITDRSHVDSSARPLTRIPHQF